MVLTRILIAELSGDPYSPTDSRSKRSLMYYDISRTRTSAMLNADHAGCIDNRKSTSRGIQFLDCNSDLKERKVYLQRMPDCEDSLFCHSSRSFTFISFIWIPIS
ncbi:hypothetical protein Tco_0760624 [Tanacetum coccineum]